VSAYDIVQIPGWEDLSLLAADRAALEHRLDELAHQAVPDEVPRDSATPFRRELRGHLGRLVGQARASGAALLSLPTGRVGGSSVAASYTVSQWRDTTPTPVPPPRMITSLAEASEAVTSRLDVDGQPALREETIVDPALGGDPLATRAGRRVTYTIASPDDERAWVVFAFVTLGDGDPRGPLADVLVELFDAQLSTLRWRLGSE
jgi:hypothetical protein